MIASRQVPAVLLCDAGTEHRFAGIDGLTLVTVGGFLTSITGLEALAPEWSQDPEDVAVLLYTSGTSGEPKAAVLRHRHLTSYVLGAVEFMGAGEDEATLVSVPPYHIAGISAILTSVYGGRRLVQLPPFAPDAWVASPAARAITHAMVVPTMLGRILDVLDRRRTATARLPTLRHLSYGGGRMPVPVIERALALLPDVDFVNAYGLTETSSTIARARRPTTTVTPRQRRTARTRPARLGRPAVADRGDHDPRPRRRGPASRRATARSGCAASRCPASTTGAGQRTGDGWFPTNDGGWLDDDGYLFVEGRLDDVIVRGGENLSPGEIEDVLPRAPGGATMPPSSVFPTRSGARPSPPSSSPTTVTSSTSRNSATSSSPTCVRPGDPPSSRSVARCQWAIPARC